MSDKVVLQIDRNSSTCQGCGRPADPREKAHFAAIGYKPEPGCGAAFTHVTTHYVGKAMSDRVKEMRPDLEFIG